MSLDLKALREAVASHGRVARVVIAGHEGSSPREVGAEMLVWLDGQSGTIGGGALEWQAARTAREMLPRGGARVQQAALGPALGQCCGGAVTLVYEIFDAARLREVETAARDDVAARPVKDMAAAEPLSVRRLLAATRGGQGVPQARLVDGWLVEPLSHSQRPLWIWGAGHVGRAIVATAAPLPEFALTWVDTGMERFPVGNPHGLTQIVAAFPPDLVAHAPADAEHLILTYSHALDLELCHRLLLHGFAAAGLIGSRSKWARFRSRLRTLGHDASQIARITCPIGDPRLGKHPQAIAVGVVAALLARQDAGAGTEGRRA